jgi:hypothetical protein
MGEFACVSTLVMLWGLPSHLPQAEWRWNRSFANRPAQSDGMELVAYFLNKWHIVIEACRICKLLVHVIEHL